MHFTEILNLAARAWHETKADADPEFNDCTLTHRENLGAAVKAVVDSEQVFTDFDRVVLRLYLADRESKGKAEQILDSNPLLHGDEVVHIASGLPHPLAGSHAEDLQRRAAREEFRDINPSSLDAVSAGGSKVSFETTKAQKPIKK